MPEYPYNRIVIIQTAFIGDLILTTPLIRAVNNLFEPAWLDVVVIPQTAGILKNNPYINRVISFNKRKDKKRAFKKTLHTLRKNAYDLAIVPHRSLTSSMLAWHSGIKRRIGFSSRLSSFFFTDTLPLLKNIPEMQRNLQLLKAFTDQEFSINTEIFPDIFSEMKAKTVLPPDSEHPLIAIAPGSVWSTKRLPEEHYIDLTRNLYSDGYQLVFIGSEGERDLCERIITGAEAYEALNLAGKTNLLESAAVIGRCDLMICNDSGALHIANAVNTDVFAFFGPTVESLGFFPYRDRDRVFEIELYCRPCGKHGGKKCPEGHFRCMKEIKMNTVHQAVQNHFRKQVVSIPHSRMSSD